MEKNKIRLVENVIDDIFRFIRWIIPLAISFALGYLFCYYYHVSTTIQSIIDRPINCISTISLPIEQPRTWI